MCDPQEDEKALAIIEKIQIPHDLVIRKGKGTISEMNKFFKDARISEEEKDAIKGIN